MSYVFKLNQSVLSQDVPSARNIYLQSNNNNNQSSSNTVDVISACQTNETHIPTDKSSLHNNDSREKVSESSMERDKFSESVQQSPSDLSVRKEDLPLNRQTDIFTFDETYDFLRDSGLDNELRELERTINANTPNSIVYQNADVKTCNGEIPSELTVPTESDSSSTSSENSADLTSSQKELRDLHTRTVNERKKDQEMATLEKKRLNEIIEICADYQKDFEKERRNSSEMSPRSELKSVSGIKTNGSLTKLTFPNMNIESRRSSSVSKDNWISSDLTPGSDECFLDQPSSPLLLSVPARSVVKKRDGFSSLNTKKSPDFNSLDTRRTSEYSSFDKRSQDFNSLDTRKTHRFNSLDTRRTLETDIDSQQFNSLRNTPPFPLSLSQNFCPSEFDTVNSSTASSSSGDALQQLVNLATKPSVQFNDDTETFTASHWEINQLSKVRLFNFFILVINVCDFLPSKIFSCS